MHTQKEAICIIVQFGTAVKYQFTLKGKERKTSLTV
jgi:hypothetical protein